MSDILISIIIPVLNSEKTIKNCINSIVNQSYKNYEILIFDSCSIDNTRNIINDYHIDSLRYYCEKDFGLYDAMNKGISLAKGSWIYFMGSDDKFIDNSVLEKVSNVLKKTNKKVVYGSVKLTSPTNWSKGKIYYDGKFTLYKLLRRNICHQAIFYQLDNLKKHNINFNLDYNISADWDFNIKLWIIESFQYFDCVICLFSSNGLSSSGGYDKFNLIIKEKYKYYFKNPFRNKLSRSLYYIYVLIKKYSS